MPIDSNGRNTAPKITQLTEQGWEPIRRALLDYGTAFAECALHAAASRQDIARSQALKAMHTVRLAVEATLAATAQPTHRHVKRGTLYTELGRGTLQTDVPLTDMAELVVYQSADGALWFRSPIEFDDQVRFTRKERQ